MRISDWSSDVCSSDLEPRRYVFQQRMGLAIADINEDYALDFLDVIRFQRMTPDLYALGVRQNVNELPAVPSVRPDRQGVVYGKGESVRVTLGGRSIIKYTKTISAKDNSIQKNT